VEAFAVRVRVTGGESVSTPFVVRAMSALHRFWYKLTGGKLGGRFGKAPVLLLETRGRKTGKVRVTPLMYVKWGEDYALMASNGGRDSHPAWYLNLQANPSAHIQVGRARRPVTARAATPEEEKALWPRFVSIYKSYESYQQKTSRKIPIVVLHPTG
jgi:deazaflavin-dependent oxidoreductase (nitroreductase family)